MKEVKEQFSERLINKITPFVTAEKLIARVSPAWALKRQSARQEMSAQGKSYNAASTASAVFQNFLTFTEDADSSVIWDRDLLVERSRDNVRNIPIATALIKRICDHAIGDKGLSLHSQIDREFLGLSEDEATTYQKKAESIWKSFAENEESDFNREINFNEKTYLTLQSELEGGDCFSLFVNKKRSGSEFDLKIQTLEGEYCSTPGNIKSIQRSEGQNQITEGFEKDKDGVNIANHFSVFHPGDRLNFSNSKWTRRTIFSPTGRRNILHHFDKIRPGQTRGIPVLGPVTGKLLQIGRLSDAELMASVLNSYYAIVLEGETKDTLQTKKSPNDSNTSRTTDDKLTLGSGSILRVKPGVKVSSFDPARPNLKFWEFFQSIVAEIGASVGVPKSIILMIYDKSYSASRGEVLLAWVYFLSKRTHIAINLCQPTYGALMDEAVSKGMISAPGYFLDQRVRRAYLGSPYEQWTGPTRPAIDELREAKAFEVFNNMGTQSRKEIIAKTTGKTFERVTEQLTREHSLRVSAGLETEETDTINKAANENT